MPHHFLDSLPSLNNVIKELSNEDIFNEPDLEYLSSFTLSG